MKESNFNNLKINKKFQRNIYDEVECRKFKYIQL